MSKVSFMTKNFHRYDPMSIESYLTIGGLNPPKNDPHEGTKKKHDNIYL